MQRYCRPVKAIEVGDRVYRTPAPAAKAIAWFIAQDLIKPELDFPTGTDESGTLIGKQHFAPFTASLDCGKMSYI